MSEAHKHSLTFFRTMVWQVVSLEEDSLQSCTRTRVNPITIIASSHLPITAGKHHYSWMHVCQRSRENSSSQKKYVTQFLLPNVKEHMLPSLVKLVRLAGCQQDADLKHTSKATKRIHHDKRVNIFPWPCVFPNEHLWEVLKKLETSMNLKKAPGRNNEGHILK